MSRLKSKSVFDNPFALNFDPTKLLFAGRSANTDFFSELMAYNTETLAFVRKRFEQDVRLAEDMAGCDEAAEAMGTWLDFLRQAQIDYSDEMARLLNINTRIAGTVASHAEQEARSLTEEYGAATAA